MPDIAAVATKLTELDVVAMRGGALLEDKDELVLAAVERAHSGIVFDPDTQILELAIGLAAGGQQFIEMAPIHADVVQRPGGTEGDEIAETRARKAVNSALLISPEAIGNGRWCTEPRPLA